jgi:Holliday junction resolvase
MQDNNSHNAETGEKYKELSNGEKCKKAEELFLHFLNYQKIPFVYVDQSFEKTSKEMRMNNIRRPDYIVHTKNFVYYIDIKYRNKIVFGENKEKRFYLNHDEIDELYNFQIKLNSVVWIALTDNLETPEFFFSPISKVHEFYLYILNGIKNHHPEMYEYIFCCYICLPDILLYNRFSFEDGFYNEPITGYSTTEVNYHVDNMINVLRALSYKDFK